LIISASWLIIICLPSAAVVALEDSRLHIVPDYIGRQSRGYFLEPDGVPDKAIEKLEAVLAGYGDSARSES